MAKVDDRLLARSTQSYLEGLDDEVVSCLGDHHNWPKLSFRPGRKLPDGVSARPQRDGCFQIRVTCPDCGRVRWKTTLPGGTWDGSAKWEYSGGPRPPKGLGLTRADYSAENGRRITGALYQQLGAGSKRQAVSLAKRAARQ